MLKKIIISVCFLMAFNLSAKETAAVNELADKISNLITFKADFEQSVKNELGKEIDLSSGEFFIEKPNHFRWHVKQQFEQLIIADGDHIYTYDPELEQVTVQNQSKALTDSPLLFLTSNAQQLAKSFDISKVKIEADKEQDKQLFFLKPKGSSGIFESVHILFENNILVELLTADTLGQKTSVTFSNALLNQKLDSHLFSFEMPEGIDIIDSREKVIP